MVDQEYDVIVVGAGHAGSPQRGSVRVQSMSKGCLA